MNRAVLPNILVAGPTSAGKTTMCGEIIQSFDMQWLDVNKVAKSRDCIARYDNMLEVMFLDEAKIINEFEPIMEEGGKMIEYHSCDLFPEKWFHFTFVLSVDNDVLYKRLLKKGFNSQKIAYCMDFETAQEVHEETLYCCENHTVFKCVSNDDADMERNVKLAVNKIKQWKKINVKTPWS